MHDQYMMPAADYYGSGYDSYGSGYGSGDMGSGMFLTDAAYYDGSGSGSGSGDGYSYNYTEYYGESLPSMDWSSSSNPKWRTKREAPDGQKKQMTLKQMRLSISKRVKRDTQGSGGDSNGGSGNGDSSSGNYNGGSGNGDSNSGNYGNDGSSGNYGSGDHGSGDYGYGGYSSGDYGYDDYGSGGSGSGDGGMFGSSSDMYGGNHDGAGHYGVVHEMHPMERMSFNMKALQNVIMLNKVVADILNLPLNTTQTNKKIKQMKVIILNDHNIHCFIT